MPAPLRRLLATPLWAQILIGMVLGVIAGLVLGERAAALRIVGDLFLRLVRMMVVPMIFVMVVSAIAAMGDARRLGVMGVRTVAAFLVVMVVAVASGLGLGLWLQPGAQAHLAAVASKLAIAPAPQDQLLAIVPTNIVEALVHGDLVAILFFALLFGIGILLAGESGRSIGALFQSAMAVLLKMIGLIMQTAPLGVFALTATAVGELGPGVFAPILRLALAVLAGSLFQVLVVHVGVARLGGLKPLTFLRGIAGPMLIAFTSTSAAATLPASLTAAEVNLGLGEVVPAIVLPLGVVIGKTGVGMFLALMAMFAAQALHIPVSPPHLLVVGAAALLLAATVPTVPSGSLMVLAGVMSVVGASDAQAALVLGLVLPFDRPLDMMRTIPNVTGGLAVSAWLAKRPG